MKSSLMALYGFFNKVAGLILCNLGQVSSQSICDLYCSDTY